MITNQFTIYTSSDPYGPGAVNGITGSLLPILDACLVNGYGTGSYFKSGSGWTKPFPNSGSADSGSNIYGAWTQGTGSRFTLFINDSGPNTTAAGKEAWGCGWETLTNMISGYPAINVGIGLNQFPTSTQAVLSSGHVVFRKSISADTVARQWVIAADGATFYMWIASGDAGTAGTGYLNTGFGDCYSLAGSNDRWNCFIYGRPLEDNISAGNSDWTDQICGGPWSANANQLTLVWKGHWMARNGFGTGTSINITRKGDFGACPPGQESAVTVGAPIAGVLPSPVLDNSLYMSPLLVVETGTLPVIRGRFRGLYQIGHAESNFSNGQIISGSSDYTGKVFMVIAPSNEASMWALEISPTIEFN